MRSLKDTLVAVTPTMNLLLISLIISSVLALSFPANAATSSAVVEKSTAYSVGVSNLRNKRYCEVLYGNRSSLSLVLRVFSTEGLNDCPEEAWQSISKKSIADSREASFVMLNGPRYWTIDGLQAAGEGTVNHNRESFGAIEMNLRATLKIGLLQQLRHMWGDTAYRTNEVARNTKWIYKAGLPVFELISPSGELYVMQSYAQIINPRLSLADLPTLEKQLKLPKGWSYRARLLTEDLNLVADGVAYVIQDSLMNTYQRQ